MELSIPAASSRSTNRRSFSGSMRSPRASSAIRAGRSCCRVRLRAQLASLLLWLIVRRYFGSMAATIAGLVLAFTPIWVSVSRLNLPEPFYLLALVAAAYCIIQSFESRRWWAWLACAGLMVGVAFNTKMLFGGAADLFRMFDPANGGQIAWFLPFALIGSVFSLWRWRLDGA